MRVAFGGLYLTLEASNWNNQRETTWTNDTGLLCSSATIWQKKVLKFYASNDLVGIHAQAVIPICMASTLLTRHHRKFWPFLGSDNKPLTLRHPKELLRWQHLTNNYVLNMNWNTQITSTIVKETERLETVGLFGTLLYVLLKSFLGLPKRVSLGMLDRRGLKRVF